MKKKIITIFIKLEILLQFHFQISVSIVGCLQKPFAMHYGSAWNLWTSGIPFQILHFVSCAPFHRSGTWFSSYMWKGKIISWWQWSCEHYGTKEINQLRVGLKEFLISGQVIPQASQSLSDFQDTSTSARHVDHTNSQIQWSPPPSGSLKINFDGATFLDLGMAGLGVVIPFSPDIVEAMAAVRAISFPQELGLNSFILEGDSTTVINSLNSAENSLSPFGHILSSAKSTLVIRNCISFSQQTWSQT